MRRWLYVLGGVVVVLAIVVVAVPESDEGEVHGDVVAFRQARQGERQTNPCALMTPAGRTTLIGAFPGGPPPAADAACAAQARDSGVYRYKRQREVPADTETAVVVQGDQAAAAEVVDGRVGFEALLLVRKGERWLIASPDEVPASQALAEALERGEGA